MWVDHYKLCKCGGQCKLRWDKAIANDGRSFLCCPQSTRLDNHSCRMFEWIEQVPEIISNQETGQCLQGPTTNMATVSRSSGYLKGYLSGVVFGYRNATKMLDELIDAVDKLDLE